jgi:hypothetical protein
MRRSVSSSAVVLALTAACAGAGKDSAGTTPGDADALVGNTGGAQGDAGAGGVVPLPGPDCTPGAALGLCHVCTPDGRPGLPADDPACPPVDCAGFDTYERAEADGQIVCRRVAAAPLPEVGRCTGPGQCLFGGTAALCGAQGEAVEIARADSACATMTACAGTEPPVVTPGPAGAPCNGVGTCRDDGTCSVSATCARFPGQIFCLEESVEGAVQCEFYVATPDGSKTTCAAFCEGSGGCCVDAWPEAEDASCEHGGTSNCIDEHSDLVCRCRLRSEAEMACPMGAPPF